MAPGGMDPGGSIAGAGCAAGRWHAGRRASRHVLDRSAKARPPAWARWWPRAAGPRADLRQRLRARPRREGGLLRRLRRDAALPDQDLSPTRLAISGNQFSDAGDSGSLVVDAGQRRAGGPVFRRRTDAAGSEPGRGQSLRRRCWPSSAPTWATAAATHSWGQPITASPASTTATIPSPPRNPAQLNDAEAARVQQGLAQARLLINPSAGVLGVAMGKSSDHAGEGRRHFLRGRGDESRRSGADRRRAHDRNSHQRPRRGPRLGAVDSARGRLRLGPGSGPQPGSGRQAAAGAQPDGAEFRLLRRRHRPEPGQSEPTRHW
jgi:hypothetical protein